MMRAAVRTPHPGVTTGIETGPVTLRPLALRAITFLYHGYTPSAAATLVRDRLANEERGPPRHRFEISARRLESGDFLARPHRRTSCIPLPTSAHTHGSPLYSSHYATMLSRTRTATRPIRGLAGVQTASKRISPHSSGVVVLRSAGAAAVGRNSSSFARGSFTPPVLATATATGQPPQRGLSGTAVRRKGQVKPFVLADIGEGITECEIVKWCVQSLTCPVQLLAYGDAPCHRGCETRHNFPPISASECRQLETET